MNFSKSRFLVTGGAGFIGSHIVDRLIKEGAREVVVLDNFVRGRPENLKQAQKSGKLNLIIGDLRDNQLVNEIISGIDYVFHETALRITQCADNPRLCQEVVIDGTFNIFEACVKNKVKKIIFASSASVYGDPSYLPMDEKHPYNNLTFYGAGKIANEHLARAFNAQYNLSYIGLRYFNVYGPRMDIYGVYTEVMIKWINKITLNEAPIIHGDGKQSMDFVYIDDVVEANIKALISKNDKGIFNVGTGTSTDLNKLYKTMAKILKFKKKPVYKTPKKLIIVSHRRADTRLAKKILGFEARVKLKDGLKKLIEWKQQKKQPNL